MQVNINTVSGPVINAIGGQTFSLTVSKKPIPDINVSVAGVRGIGIPSGGSVGQVLSKISGIDYATGWIDVAGGSVSWGDVTGKPLFATVAVSGNYDDLTGKPLLGTAAGAATTDFATASQGVLAATASQPGHTHTQADVTGLVAALAGKASSVHGHVIADVTGLQPALDGKQPLSAVLTATTASFTTADEIKLDGIEAGATANSTDATLLARANHTGTQAQDTVDGLVADLAAKQSALVSGANIKTINGTTLLGAGDLTISSGSASVVAARIYRNTNQSIPGGGVFANLVWSTAAYEIGGDVWTSGDTVTIAETGLTRINIEATFDGTELLTIATSNMELVLNGSTIIGEDEVMVAIGAKGSLNVMAQRIFTAGDTLIVRVKHSDAGSLNILAQGGHSPDIILTKVGGAKGDPGAGGGYDPTLGWAF